MQIDFFEFGKKEYDYLVEQCMLNEDYAKILKYKIKGYSRQKIADELHVSIENLDKMIAKLKKKIKKIL